MLRVVFLVGLDDRATRDSIEQVCRIPGVQPVALLFDTYTPPLKRRLKNLSNNIRKHGYGYLPHRALSTVRSITERMVDRAVVSQDEVAQLLRKAFPDRSFDLNDVARKCGFPIQDVGSLNSPFAIEALKKCDADLGIVLGTRVLKQTTFSVPRMGSINLHKGKVPDYRGMPPGFWELYDGAKTAGVTVHFVDSKLDTGDIIETSEIPILEFETPDSLMEKLHVEGTRALVRAVTAIEQGVAVRRPQPELTRKPRTSPTLAQAAELRSRLPHWRVMSPGREATKNLVYLALYYSGIYDLVRKSRKSRAAIILHHRVNDYSKDILTVDTETFAAQLLAIQKRYATIGSMELVERLRAGKPLHPTSVLIHFDDAYLDVHTEGRPILKALGIPATAFINSGFVGTDRVFNHDRTMFPFHFPNCEVSDLQRWLAEGFEIGAHTVNHADMGRVTAEDAQYEILTNRAELEQMTGRPVSLFSFPFGRPDNLSREAADCVRKSGFAAMFSAYGGTVDDQADPFNIQRLGASWETKPLSLLLEIEGLSGSIIINGLLRKLGLRRRALPGEQPAPVGQAVGAGERVQ